MRQLVTATSTFDGSESAVTRAQRLDNAWLPIEALSVRATAAIASPGPLAGAGTTTRNGYATTPTVGVAPWPVVADPLRSANGARATTSDWPAPVRRTSSLVRLTLGCEG